MELVQMSTKVSILLPMKKSLLKPSQHQVKIYKKNIFISHIFFITKAIINKFIPKKELIYLNFLKHENIVELKDYFIEDDSGLLCLV